MIVTTRPVGFMLCSTFAIQRDKKAGSLSLPAFLKVQDKPGELASSLVSNVRFHAHEGFFQRHVAVHNLRQELNGRIVHDKAEE